MRTILTAALLFMAYAASAAEKEVDNYSVPGVYAMGNGNMCVYGQQANVLQIFGPPYSSPSFINIHLLNNCEVISERFQGAAVWKHSLYGRAKKMAVQTDFVTSDTDCYIRAIEANEPVEYDVNIRPQYYGYDSLVTVCLSDEKSRWKQANQIYTVSVAPGMPLYNSYKFPTGYCYKIIATGSATLFSSGAENRKLLLKVDKGKGELIIVAGKTPEEADRLVKKIAASSTNRLLKKTIESWRSYSSERDKSLLFDGEVRRTIEDIDILIRCQQGVEGGVLAGINYHLGYVRDQYGVSRALLAMGHNKEARSILDFYYDIWKKYGFIKNAQAIGVEGIFHCHENDEVEITGYLTVQAFDYYRKTHDETYMRQIVPMLEWAMEAQRQHIIDGMLPFNGDETYIAGGLLPRKVMNDGSAEATLLFIEGGERLLDFIREQKLWKQEKITDWETIIGDCKKRYRDNFLPEGKLYINNPARADREEKFPPTRPGVCMHPEHGGYYTELFHFEGPFYFCGNCIKKANNALQLPRPERFHITSAYLFPFYISAQLFTNQEKLQMLDVIIDKYQQTGKISDLDQILGYDYGMFLYALADTGNALAGEVYQRMMALRDNTGAWVEYYHEGIPSGCQCRPWESGINIEAAIRYWERSAGKSGRGDLSF